MINLFNSIYVRTDDYVAASTGQKRIILSSRDYGWATDKETLDLIGVIDILPTMKDLTDKYGSLDGFWSMLRLSNEKIIIIAGQEQLLALLISYWKKIFKAPSVESLYRLYQFFIFNENLFYAHFSRYSYIDKLDEEVRIKPVSLEEFVKMYEHTPASEMMSGLSRQEIPIEYLLAGYFAGVNDAETNLVTFRKVKTIVLQNLAGILAGDRAQFFTHTHNQYLLDGASDSVEIFDPMEILQSNPKYSWLFDKEFRRDNLDGIIQKYPPRVMKELFGQFNKIFYHGKGFFYEAEGALDFIIAGDIPGLLAYDVQDENATFFTETEFFKKVNTLLISHFYQLVRLNRSAELKVYELA